MPKFNDKSLSILNTAHPDLIRLFMAVIEEYDCSIICGYRNKADQEKAFNEGNSKAHFGSSPHNFIPSLAVDAVPYPSLWADDQKLKELGGIIQIKAIDLGIEIMWGGNFKNFIDMPHYELLHWKQIKSELERDNV
jgi:peptidoglycan L-alanyl-D-glutamate endopeptidase CwlK